MVALVFSGCAGGGSSNPPPPPQTYAISGSVTPQSLGSGTNVALSGPSSSSTTTDSSGNYSFTGLANGAYVVTPSRSGYSFSPTQQTVTVNGANIAKINFAASAQPAVSVTLTWQASVSAVSGYNVYRGTTDGGPYTQMNSSLITVLTYTDTAVTSGNTYYYVSTAVDSSNVESVYSNQATAKIP